MSDNFDRLKSALASKYEIERELGAGGMATVYLADDVKHRRKVALKVLRPELAAAIGPDRFLREIEIAAGLNHPHILPLHDSSEADGFLYYVMPYMEGESLRGTRMRSASSTRYRGVRKSSSTDRGVTTRTSRAGRSLCRAEKRECSSSSIGRCSWSRNTAMLPQW